MEKKKEILLTDTENYEGYYPTREHLLIFNPEKFKKFEKYIKEKKSKKIDPVILDLFLSI